MSVLPRRHATLVAETHAARSDGLCVRESQATRCRNLLGNANTLTAAISNAAGVMRGTVNAHGTTPIAARILELVNVTGFRVTVRGAWKDWHR